MRNATAAFVLLALLIPSASAAPDELRSGPEVGVPVPPLSAFAATGNQAGQDFDIIAQRQGKPTVFLFVQAQSWGRPMARFIKTLDEQLAQGIAGAPDAAAVAIWLTDDPDQSKAYLPRAQQSIQLEKTPLAVFEGGRIGPDGWSINDMAGLTAVVVRDGKVVASTGYLSLNATDVPKVIEAIRGH